jgi:hypothetical protein
MGVYNWSLWYHVTDPTAMAVIHAIVLLILLLFTIGLATPVTSVLTWVAAVSYIQRSPTTLFGMDTMMNLLLLYLMIGQSGAALSVDRLIQRYRLTRQALSSRRPAPDLALAPRVSANLALRLIQVNLCIIYFAAGVSKLQGTSWWTWTAIWGTLANPEFSPLYIRPYYAVLEFLSHHRVLWEMAMSGGVVFTLSMELGFPFLVWNRNLRWLMLTMALMMHLGIATFMGLNTFSLMMGGMLLAFVPPQSVRWLLEALGRQAPNLRLLFNGRAATQVRAASLIHALDAWDQVDIEDSAGPGRPRGARDKSTAPAHVGTSPFAEVPSRLQLETSAREWVSGYSLFEALVRGVRMLWPLALFTWVPGIKTLGTWLFPGGGSKAPTAVEHRTHQPAGEKVSN